MTKIFLWCLMWGETSDQDLSVVSYVGETSDQDLSVVSYVGGN